VDESIAQDIKNKVLTAYEERFTAGDDFYLDEENAYKRLKEEYEKYHTLIVSYDFDNTVFDYNKKGIKFQNVIDLLRVCKEIGCYLSVFTSDGDDRIPEIKEYLEKNNIPYDAINENHKDIKFIGRKIYYNVLLDDRAGLSSAYRILSRVAYGARSKKAQIGMSDVA
jgi:hypothetical protein